MNEISREIQRNPTSWKTKIKPIKKPTANLIKLQKYSLNSESRLENESKNNKLGVE